MTQALSRPIRAPASRAARASALQATACLSLCLCLIWTCSLPAQSPLPSPQLKAPDAPSIGPAGLVPAAAPTAKRPIVVDVKFVGNAHTKETVLYNSVHTRKNLEFDSEVVQKDVRTLMATRRFRNVIPHVKEIKDGVAVTYELIEHPFIEYIEHIGNRGLS